MIVSTPHASIGEAPPLGTKHAWIERGESQCEKHLSSLSQALGPRGHHPLFKTSFGIDRRPTDLAVERFQLLSELDQNARHDWIETAQEVALWNAFFEVERVEQPTLIARLPPHHHPSPSQNLKKTESQLDDDHEPFFNSIDPLRTCAVFVPALGSRKDQRTATLRVCFHALQLTKLIERANRNQFEAHEVGLSQR